MALLRGLLDESALRRALDSESDLLEALKAQGSLDAEDLLDLARLVKAEEERRPSPSGDADPSTEPFHSARGKDPWDSLPSSGDSTDGTGRQVLRVLTLPAWRHYRNLRFISEGGMGRVFKAFDPSLKRVVALKFLRREDPDLVTRFVLEAQNQAKVDHPNICKVFEVGEWQGQSYIAMQFIKGETLEVAAPGLSLVDRVKVMEAVAEAVHAAHRQGLIHRDLKPANIMVELEERGPKPTILDFGLARGVESTGLTVQGLVIGTVNFMAPEQARGDHARVGRRTDVYGLGATLHKVLTGQPPFGGTEGVDAIRCTVEEDVPSLARLVQDLPEDLDTIVRKCLEKDPARRYESALAVAEDLRRWREGEPILARKPTFRYRAGKWAGRHRLVVLVGALGLVVAVAFAGLGIQARLTAASQARWAQHFAQSAERMEALARYIHLSPPHDLGPELSLLRGHLNALQADLARAGREGEAPGAYALGRAHLVLGELEEAQRRLEQAEALDFNTPEAKYALGRVLSLQYQKGVQQALQVWDPSLRAAHLKALEPLLGRVMNCLRQGQGNALEPLAYQEGLLALFARRFEEAITKAEAAQRDAPWFYESLALKAEAYITRARGSADPAARSRDLEAAGSSLEAALRQAPSDPRLLETMARRWNDEMRLAWDTGKELEPLAKAQQVPLRRWELLTPGNPGPRAMAAFTQARLADCLQFKGLEPGPMVKAAVDLAEGVLKAHPDNVDARGALAAALHADGFWKLVHGGDPTPSLMGTINHCREGLGAHPGHPVLLETLVRGLVHLVEFQSTAGQELAPTWDLVQRLFTQRVLEGEAAPILVFQLASLHIEMAEADLQHDRDPRPRLQAALDLLERSRNRVGSSFDFHQRLGNAHIVWAGYLQRQGLDPSEQANAAIEAYRAATQSNSTRYETYWGLAEAFLVKARHRLGAAEDPMGELEQARRALEVFGKLEPTIWSQDWEWGESLLVEAEWLFHQKRDPEAALAGALSHAEKALARNRQRPEPWVLVAKVHRFRLESLRGGTPERGLALKALARALALDPRNREALEAKSRLQKSAAQPS